MSVTQAMIVKGDFAMSRAKERLSSFRSGALLPSIGFSADELCGEKKRHFNSPRMPLEVQNPWTSFATDRQQSSRTITAPRVKYGDLGLGFEGGVPLSSTKQKCMVLIKL